MNTWLEAEAMNEFLYPYKFSIQVMDAECGGGEMGNIQGHSHSNTRAKVTLPNGQEIIDEQIWAVPEALEVCRRINRKAFKFIDHGQELQLIMTFGNEVIHRAKRNSKARKKKFLKRSAAAA